MPFESGARVCADVSRWIVDPRPGGKVWRVVLPGVVVKVESTPDWTYSVQLDNAPVTLPGGEKLSLAEGLPEDHLTAGPCPS